MNFEDKIVKVKELIIKKEVPFHFQNTKNGGYVLSFEDPSAYPEIWQKNGLHAWILRKAENMGLSGIQNEDQLIFHLPERAQKLKL